MRVETRPGGAVFADGWSLEPRKSTTRVGDKPPRYRGTCLFESKSLQRTRRDGATGLTVGFATDDCRETYETLRARGVEISREPVEHFYGTDIGKRDPFGHHIRIVPPPPMPLQVRPPSTRG
ncbi:MAG: VOC family protein [Chloroflexota bacterium]